jgi:lysophospholipid acyltransferase (LPLAT)-like uncharacterized protein
MEEQAQIKKPKKKKKKFNKITLAIICFLFYLLFRFLSLTYRYKIIGAEHWKKAKSLHPEGGMNLGCWHENAFSAIASHMFTPMLPLISSSQDGDLVAFLTRRIGFFPVRGSSTRGGKDARDILLEQMNQGNYSAIMVDGPKGPKREVKAGIVDIARKTEIPILAVGGRGNREWVFQKSWDQTRIPKPFAKVVIAYGAPISVPKGAEGDDFAVYQQQFQKELNDLEVRMEKSLENWDNLPKPSKEHRKIRTMGWFLGNNRN